MANPYAEHDSVPPDRGLLFLKLFHFEWGREHTRCVDATTEGRLGAASVKEVAPSPKLVVAVRRIAQLVAANLCLVGSFSLLRE